MSRTVWFRRGDAIPVLLGVALTVLLLWVTASRMTDGQRLRITTPTGEQVYALSEPADFTVHGRDGHRLVVCIQDGEAFVQSADCPDRDCVRTGRIARVGQTVVCLPAGVMLTVEGGGSSPDAVAR